MIIYEIKFYGLADRFKIMAAGVGQELFPVESHLCITAADYHRKIAAGGQDIVVFFFRIDYIEKAESKWPYLPFCSSCQRDRAAYVAVSYYIQLIFILRLQFFYDEINLIVPVNIFT